jgi:hypothetical protein
MRVQITLGALAFATVLVVAAGSVWAEDADGEAGRIAEQKASMEAARGEALALLEKMSDFLGKQESFRFKSDSSYDATQALGLSLEFGAEREVLVRRPNHLRIEARDREGEVRTFRYDGSQASLMFENENAYVQFERTGSVEEMLDYAVDELDMPMPLSDLLDRNFYGAVAEKIEMAAVIGNSTIGGRSCQHVVYRTSRLDFQLWLATGDEPLPCRIVVMYTDQPGRPQFRSSFSEWELAVEAPDGQFAFRPPKGAERLPIRARPVRADAQEKGAE